MKKIGILAALMLAVSSVAFAQGKTKTAEKPHMKTAVAKDTGKKPMHHKMKRHHKKHRAHHKMSHKVTHKTAPKAKGK